MVPHGRGLTPHFGGCVLSFFFLFYFTCFRKSAAFVLIFFTPKQEISSVSYPGKLELVAEGKVRAVFCIVTGLYLLVNDWLWGLFYGNITLKCVYVCNI